ncbi:TniB family NTP-binding protein [Pseudomonas sp. LF19]|uniref:TniB family NTP-binding protein n=1 Tax=Pseudomonas sp. LF19 TaxID=2899115 RepID=UPI001F3C082D|nr:TniB family NTP-binding protein [Pseudomonas sp. LF19]MCE5981969.1 TniB family NTP-binding protein [Pseudomonas sp. LF19]
MITNAEPQSGFSLRHHFIRSPQSDHAIMRMEEVRQDTIRTQSSKGLVVQGPSGVGKSSLVREYLRNEAAGNPDWMRSVLVVEMPSSPSKKNLATAVLVAMKDPFATARGHSAEHKFTRIVTLLKNQGTAMIILDEAQHLVDYKKVGAYEAADWIKSLMNETDITVVLVGLKRTEGLLWANEQLRRRFSASIDYGRYDLTEETWKQFAALLKAIQGLLPVQCISFLSKDMLQRFHLASFGLIDYLIKILDRAVWLAQRSGVEGIDLNVLSQAFKDEVWSRVPSERNPFSTSFDFQPLVGGREPFENFDYPSD